MRREVTERVSVCVGYPFPVGHCRRERFCCMLPANLPSDPRDGHSGGGHQCPGSGFRASW